ncbi:hypothetical protein EDB81DRAFT_946375 [Dactylonectria macrodidyma]|uniref:Ubiquitin 3 binding protein But2 C-terminal domain-containing protein n=1 Tax=Dactylonectria macrodidyma TaxID=307937 RepID=A0A9P9F352_9HYPO|nr:hypothetical protein EDB81DRAFT_946375 [Dactylonectria macrodidyma]
MLFKTIISATVAATSALAAPIETRSTTSISPSAMWTYQVDSGAILATTLGDVCKGTGNGGKDTTTLLTFTYPEDVLGKQCQFEFSLDPTSGLAGSKKLDVYSSSNPAPGPTTGWGPGNQRNKPLGRLSVELSAVATWDATYDTYLTTKTPCKAGGTTEGFELVGVYDNDSIGWSSTTGAGLRIIVS